MLNKLLTKFETNNTDLGERLGNIGLGLLQIGFGRTVTVKKIADKVVFTEKLYSTSAKVAAIALFILAFPITVPFAVIGYVGMKLSKSHEEFYHSYKTGPSKSPVEIKTPYKVDEKIVITIQKRMRGYLARKSHLTRGSYPKYLAQCEKVNRQLDQERLDFQRSMEGDPESRSWFPWLKALFGFGQKVPLEILEQPIPRAGGGRTKVFLPQEMPGVVIKCSGRKDAIMRFQEMQEARSILRSQKSSHLRVPKVNLCQEFLVEERLPINVNNYHNMELYLSESQLFDEAVREMTRLFSKGSLCDLVDTQNHIPLSFIQGVGDMVRYDNLPLYVVEGKGKIGLIDLEHFSSTPSEQDLETLVRIFPLHLDIIKEEASKLKMKFDGTLLETAAEKGRKFLQVGFGDYFKWLKQKGVSNHVSSLPFQLSRERVGELTACLEKELLRCNQEGMQDYFVRIGSPHYVSEKNFFSGDPEAIAEELAKRFLPLIIDSMKAQMNGQIGQGKVSNAELVGLRSPILEHGKWIETMVQLIECNEKIKLDKSTFPSTRDVARQLIFVVMEELVKGGEIFYFDRDAMNKVWTRY